MNHAAERILEGRKEEAISSKNNYPEGN